MPRVLEGQLSGAGLRFAIIVSRFNSFITERLLGGAMDALTRTGANPDLVDVIKVPGSWEVPLVAVESTVSVPWRAQPQAYRLRTSVQTSSTSSGSCGKRVISCYCTTLASSIPPWSRCYNR